MSLLTIAEAKAHLYVTHSEQDALIQTYINAAETNTAQYLDYEIVASLSTDPLISANQVLFNDAIKSAILLNVSDLFEQRQGIITGTIVAYTKSAENLLNPFRRKGT